MGAFEEAERVLGEAAAEWPDHVVPIEGLAWAARLARRWSEALERWRRIAEREPGNVTACVQIGLAHAEMGAFEEAERVLGEAAAEWPDHVAPIEGLAWAARLAQRWPEALERWRRVAELKPRNVNARVQIGLAHAELGAFEEAERVLGEAAAEWPDHVAPIEGLAHVARLAQRWPQALERWQRVAEREPGNVNARVQIGLAHAELGAFDCGESELVTGASGLNMEGRAMSIPITASMLYDLVSCPHRVTMDVFTDIGERDEPNPFIQLLWERGTLYEK